MRNTAVRHPPSSRLIQSEGPYGQTLLVSRIGPEGLPRQARLREVAGAGGCDEGRAREENVSPCEGPALLRTEAPRQPPPLRLPPRAPQIGRASCRERV